MPNKKVNSYFIIFNFYAKCYFLMLAPMREPIIQNTAVKIIPTIPWRPNAMSCAIIFVSISFKINITANANSALRIALDFVFNVKRTDIKIDVIAETIIIITLPELSGSLLFKIITLQIIVKIIITAIDAKITVAIFRGLSHQADGSFFSIYERIKITPLDTIKYSRGC